MSVRAVSLAVLFGAMVVGGASAAERTGTAAPPTRAPHDFPVASDVRLAGDDSQTRVVVDLSEKVDIRAFTLANPYRVVIDMPQVTFQFPARAGEVARGLIKAFRFGLVMQGGSRMVIDLVRPARIDKAFVIAAANDRVGLARARQAALFISIHADALVRREGDAKGATVYTLSERRSDARAARLAESENQA